MGMSESLAGSIDFIFNHLNVVSAKNTTATLAGSASSDLLLSLLLITFGVAAVGLVLAIVSFGRRGDPLSDMLYLDERLQGIEAMLRDSVAARSLPDKRLQSEMELIRHELFDIHVALDHAMTDRAPLRQVSNG